MSSILYLFIHLCNLLLHLFLSVSRPPTRSNQLPFFTFHQPPLSSSVFNRNHTMSLHGAVVALRTLILLGCLVAIGLDIYFAKLYFEDKTVVFYWIWRWSGRAGLNLVWGVTFLVSLITLAQNHHHRRRYEPTSPPLPNDSMHKRGSGCGSMAYSLFRIIILFVMAGGMLYVTGNALANENRTIFTLSHSRESPEYALLELDFRRFDPKNLRHCPSTYADALSLLCPLDNTATALLAIVAGLVLIEASLSFVNQRRSARATYSHHIDSQHTDMEVLSS